MVLTRLASKRAHDATSDLQGDAKRICTSAAKAEVEPSPEHTPEDRAPSSQEDDEEESDEEDEDSEEEDDGGDPEQAFIRLAFAENSKRRTRKLQQLMEDGFRPTTYEGWQVMDGLATDSDSDVQDMALEEVSYDGSERAWEALDKAAASGDLGAVERVARYASETGQYGGYLGPAYEHCNALESAINGGYEEIAIFLLDPCRYHWDILQSLSHAVRESHEAIVEKIYEVYPTYVREKEKTEPSPDVLFMHLARRGDTEELKFLFEMGYNDADLIAEAFANAAGGGQLDTMQFLFDTGLVSSSELKRVHKSVARGNHHIMAFLNAKMDTS